MRTLRQWRSDLAVESSVEAIDWWLSERDGLSLTFWRDRTSERDGVRNGWHATLIHRDGDKASSDARETIDQALEWACMVWEAEKG